MSRYPPLIRWLIYAALADWLLARTLTRLGIFMPKSPMLIVFYQSLTQAGLAAAAFAGLLVLTVLLIWALKAWSTGGERPMAIALGLLVFLSIIFLFIQPPAPLGLFYQLVLISVLVHICWRGCRQVDSQSKRLAVLFPTLALLTGSVGHLTQLAGLTEPGLPLFQAGELLVVLSAFTFWLAYGRPGSGWIWIGAALPALGFTIFRLLDPATSGILAIWSTGLTLYLPWPFYTFSIWLNGVAVLASLRRGETAAGAILLLASGGFASQLTSHTFLGLIGLRLLWLQDTPEQSRLHAQQKARIGSAERKSISTYTTFVRPD